MSDKSSESKMLRSALLYVEKLNWSVLPCREDKRPYTKHGFKDASADPNIIERWWRRWPEASIGIATGRISRIFVVDVDGPEGEESLNRLESIYGKLPKTAKQATGGGGLHMFFKYPQEYEIRNSASKIGKKLDIRGAGGYVIVAPSRHPSGSRYKWIKGYSPDTLIAEAPQWLIELCKTRRKDEEDNKEESKKIFTENEIDRIRSALDCIPADDRPIWLEIGMSLHSTGTGKVMISGHSGRKDLQSSILKINSRHGRVSNRKAVSPSQRFSIVPKNTAGMILLPMPTQTISTIF